MLIFCFAGGWFCPQLAHLRPLMPWCLVYMLTVVFLRTAFTRGTANRRHAYVLAANLVMPFALWGLLRLCGVPERFGQAVFFTAVTPTATAAPVIVSLLGGNIAFAATGFLLSALVISAVLPFAVPLILHESPWAVVPMILARICFVTLLPLAAALLLRRKFGDRARAWGRKLTGSTLYAWMFLVSVIASSAAETLRSVQYPGTDIFWVLAADIGVAVLSFGLGALLGLGGYVRECSQLLGQKNTSYTTYLAFACDAPFAALGPAFYVFFHNAWNGIQLIFHKDPPSTAP